MINVTYLCLTAKERENGVIVQQLGSMFQADIAEDFGVITEHLLAEGWEVPTLVRTRKGAASYTDVAGNTWRASTFVGHDDEFNISAVPLGDLGSCLGRLHTSLSKLDYVPLHHIAHFQDTAYYAAKLKGDAHKITDRDARRLARKVLSMQESLPELLDIGDDQLIHGDTRINNVLFRAGKPFTFIDWDTAMIGSVWLDIGDMCRAFIETKLEQGEQVTKEQLTSIAIGYIKARRLAVDQDVFVESLLASTKTVALRLAMRFLDDSVDPYFSYDETKYADRLTFDVESAKLQMRIAGIINQLASSEQGYKAVIFDFFEVLHHDPYVQLLEESGKEAYNSTFRNMCEQLDLGRINYAQYMENFADHLGLHVSSVERRVQKLARMVEGMPELVQGLQSNYKTALLSNAGEEELHHLLDKNGLWDHFDEIIVSSSVGMKKPDPEIFRMTLDRLGVTAEETIFVDDNADNIAAATALGIKGILFTDHRALMEDLRHLGLTLMQSGVS
jgi:epoxide hydrolase-like predicted phosphatase